MSTNTKRILTYTIIGSLYSFALSATIMNGTVVDFTYPRLFFINLFFILVFAGVFYNVTTALIAEIGIALVFIAILPALRDYAPENDGLIHGSVSRILDLYWFARGYLPYDPAYSAPLAALCCFLMSLIAAIGLYIFFSALLLSAVGFGVFIVGWTLGYPRLEWAFFLFLVCFTAIFAMRLNNLKTYSVSSLFGLRVIPPAIAIVAVATFLPTPNTKIDFASALRVPIEAISDNMYTLFNPTKFSFQSTGFSGRGGRLGGRVVLNDRMVMRVKADERVYLAGAFYDDYTGTAWRNTGTGFGRNELFLDYIETVSRLYDMRRAGDSHIVKAPWFKGNDRLQREVTIDIGRNRTATIFQPPKAFELDLPGAEVLINGNGTLEASEILAKDTSYTIKYVSLKEVDKSYLETVLEYSGKDRLALSDMFGYDYYAKLSDEEISRYSALPDKLPERVRELAISLTENNTGEYRKAKAIEEYLLEIPYTLSPETVPSGRDFVDYFLFDGKEGYCTYFATAMAVLSRAADIPSRYVEGYVLPDSPAADGYYYVTNANAHSWAEIYIEGFGWVLFEATGPYYFLGTSEAPVVSEDMALNAAYERHMDNLGIDTTMRSPTWLSQDPPSASSEPAAQLSTRFKSVFLLFVTLSVVMAYYYGIIILYRLFKRIEHHYVEQMSNKKQAEFYFSRLRRMCDYRYRYARKRADETLAMYAGRLGRRFVFRNESACLMDVVDVVYKLRYSGRPISEEELAVIRDGYFEMWRQLCEITPRYVLVRDKWCSRL